VLLVALATVAESLLPEPSVALVLVVESPQPVPLGAPVQVAA